MMLHTANHWEKCSEDLPCIVIPQMSRGGDRYLMSKTMVLGDPKWRRSCSLGPQAWMSTCRGTDAITFA